MQVPENPKLLVRVPNWLGDAVMASGVITQIKDLWPSSTLHLVGYGAITELFEADPRVEKVFKIKKQKTFWKKLSPFKSDLKEINKNIYDLTILLTNSFSSAWDFRFVNSKYRLGFSNEKRDFLLTHAISFPKKRKTQHLVITYQSLLSEGVETKASRVFEPHLYLSDEQNLWCSKFRSEKLIPLGEKVVGFNPSAAYGPAKRWLPERFKECTERFLNERKETLIYFGDPSAKDLIDEILEGLDSPRLINLCGQTSMSEFVAALSLCDCLITNDSGPMHLCAALKRPLVALFGSTDDTVTGPYGIGHVIHKRVQCSPCFLRECPIDFPCMKEISVDEVFNETLSQLES